MPLYVGLAKFTDQGLKGIKDWPARALERQRNLPPGFKYHGFYVTQGQYDAVAILEAPSQDEALKYVVNIVAQGNVGIQTMPAVTLEHFGELMKQ